MHIHTRFLTATLAAIVAAGAAVTAQGAIHGVNVQGTSAVGTLRIEGLSDAPTPIFALALSVTQTATSSTGGGGGAGKATFSDVLISRQPDSTSPALFKRAATGQHIPKVQIDVFRQNSSVAEASYILTDVLISSYSTDGAFEKIAFNYEKIEFITGGASACFSVSGNVSC